MIERQDKHKSYMKKGIKNKRQEEKMEIEKVKSRVEAILFAAGRQLNIK